MRAVNLIPTEERASSGIDAGRAGGGVYAVFALLGGLAIMALLYGLAAHQISSRKAQVAALNARVAQAEAHTAALAPYTSFAQMREQRVQAVNALVSSRFDWAQAFHELGRVLPSNVSLASLEGQIGSSTGTSSAGAASASPSSSASSASSGSKAGASGASSSPVSSATPPGSVPTFKLSGCTTGQAQVAVMLDRLRLIEGVDEVTLQSSVKSNSAGGGGGAGSCPSGDVSFSATVTFQALPSVTVSASGTKTAVAATSAAGSSAGASR